MSVSIKLGVNTKWNQQNKFRAKKTNAPFMIGICGGIACGKTTLTKILKNDYLFNSGRVFNADLQSRDALKNEKIRNYILNKYPELKDKIKGNEIDKRLLREWVLKDTSHLNELESLIHPFVSKKAKLYLQWCRRQRFRWLIWDIPLLWETNYASACHVVICLKVKKEVRLLRSSSKMKEELFNFLIRKQFSNNYQQKLSDITFNNNGSKTAFRAKYIKLMKKKGNDKALTKGSRSQINQRSKKS